MTANNKFLILSVLLLITRLVVAQDTITVKKPINLNSSNFIYTKLPAKSDSSTIKIPKYQQGFFCNFEDQIQRKKVPLNFSLGNNKY